MDRAALQVIPGGPLVVDAAVRSDPAGFQSGCVDDYWASCVARGFSAVTIENDAGVLERVLALLGRPAWDVTAEDVDRVVGGLAADGLASSTRRGYVQAFKGFHRFLQSRKAVEIDAPAGFSNPVFVVGGSLASTRPSAGAIKCVSALGFAGWVVDGWSVPLRRRPAVCGCRSGTPSAAAGRRLRSRHSVGP